MRSAYFFRLFTPVEGGHAVDFRRQLIRQLAGQEPPRPVAALGAGDVHAVSLAQTQIVLHLCHEQLTTLDIPPISPFPVEALVLCQRQIFGGVGVSSGAASCRHSRGLLSWVPVADAVGV